MKQMLTSAFIPQLPFIKECLIKSQTAVYLKFVIKILKVDNKTE